MYYFHIFSFEVPFNRIIGSVDVMCRLGEDFCKKSSTGLEETDSEGSAEIQEISPLLPDDIAYVGE